MTSERKEKERMRGGAKADMYSGLREREGARNEDRGWGEEGARESKLSGKARRGAREGRSDRTVEMQHPSSMLV